MTYILARPEPTKIRINEFMQERRGISADTVLRLARFFNTSHQFWLNLQSNFDVKCAQDAPGKVISSIWPWVSRPDMLPHEGFLCF